jgi:hypothetical protein
MKYLLFICITLSLEASAQVTYWNVCINDKVILKGSDSNGSAKPATIEINRSLLKANTFLHIELKEPASNIQWNRDFIFSSPSEETLLVKKFERSAGKFSIPFAEILPKTGKEKNIHLYTELHPADPEMSIRSKRTPLAIIQLK